MSSSTHIPILRRLVSVATLLVALFLWTHAALAQSAYVRVSQVGYETGETPFRAYLMSTAAENGATSRSSIRKVPSFIPAPSILC